MAICINSSEYKTAACIDIQCEIQAVPFAQLSQMQPGEPSAVIRERVVAARKIQEERFKPFKGTFAWWASYLSDREGKIIIAPSRWFANPNWHSNLPGKDGFTYINNT